MSRLCEILGPIACQNSFTSKLRTKFGTLTIIAYMTTHSKSSCVHLWDCYVSQNRWNSNLRYRRNDVLKWNLCRFTYLTIISVSYISSF